MSTGLFNKWGQRIAYVLLVKRGRNFHFWLAFALCSLLIVDQASLRLVRGMQNSTYDLLMRHRQLYPIPDRDIVIIDIDDASLSALAPRYGRWPWPRGVVAEVVEKLSDQKPRAIVFDILFSERDLADPASDALLAATVKQRENVFVPMVLLGDMGSHSIAMERIPGASRAPTGAPSNETMSVAMPYFSDQLPPGRIGTDNVDPDQDGVIRRFELFQDHHGWRIPSIPLRVAQTLRFPAQESGSMLLNWRGPPYSYPYVSFSTVLEQVQKNDTARLHKDFSGKIVLVGSTAASLFDLRSTPMGKVHPGVEILANVIDNLKNDDPLNEPSRWITLGVAIAFVAALAWAFRTGRHSVFSDAIFIALQLLLVAVSFVALNLSTLYLDMTVPITMGLAYFTIARIHAHFAERVLANHASYFIQPKPGQEICFSAMTLELETTPMLSGHSISIDTVIASSSLGASRLTQLFDGSQVLRSMFSDTVLIYWVRSWTEDAAFVQQDADRIVAALGAKRRGRIHSTIIAWDEPLALRHSGRKVVAGALNDLIKQP